MTFQLDTTGTVDANKDQHIAIDGQLYIGVGWGILSPFMQGYIEALFASDFSDLAEAGWTPPSFRDLAPETLARIIADCAVLEARFETAPTDPAPGRRFYAHRQQGDHHDFPPLTVQLGEDGKVRFAS